MLALLAAAAFMAPPACAADSPASLSLTGLPAVAITGKAYAATLSGDGPVVDSAGSDIGIKDANGRGWNAHFEYARGVTQPFSLSLARSPFTVTASWTEPGPCLRTVTVSLPTQRRILAVVACKRGATAPAGLTLRCDGPRLRLGSLTWSGWNGAKPVGHGRLNGRPVRVTLSRPDECSEVDGFIYTRATVKTAARTLKLPVDCPLPPRS
ncbi:hypothetical protein [Solirubrobacter soli]|uniref:hypothetical protein n=1 Tax=Solirubrobacter soli TaxID=363832 RepID=UPI000428770B|nr:hypothetical protein [Solirubrobacter soli]